jgi:tryptophan synthase beta chain
VSAGLDYPGVGPEHAWLRDAGRVRYAAIDDHQALEAFQGFARLEGIIPALETGHAIAWIDAQRGALHADDLVLLCLSGRGDKDVAHVAAQLEMHP